MKFGDKKLIKTDFILNNEIVARKGEDVIFQDSIQHTQRGMTYQFKTESGKHIWLVETQFKNKRIIPSFKKQ